MTKYSLVFLLLAFSSVSWAAHEPLCLVMKNNPHQLEATAHLLDQLGENEVSRALNIIPKDQLGPARAVVVRSGGVLKLWSETGALLLEQVVPELGGNDDPQFRVTFPADNDPGKLAFVGPSLAGKVLEVEVEWTDLSPSLKWRKVAFKASKYPILVNRPYQYEFVIEGDVATHCEIYRSHRSVENLIGSFKLNFGDELPARLAHYGVCFKSDFAIVEYPSRKIVLWHVPVRERLAPFSKK